MTDEQRELLLKAQQSLAAAKLLLTNNYPDYATSRAYYSMFYNAVTADQATEQIDHAEQFLALAIQEIGAI
jgi:hypothetical protein